MTKSKTILLSTSALLVSIFLSRIFDFSLSNTWQAGVSLFFIFGPWWKFCWMYTQNHQSQFLFLFSRFVLILLLVGYVISIIAFPLKGSIQHING